MIAGQMCYVVRCETCGKPAGPWRWTSKQAAADAKAAPGWESHFCPACKNKPCERSGATVTPSGLRYTGD